jgi:hypothetical protein
VRRAPELALAVLLLLFEISLALGCCLAAAAKPPNEVDAILSPSFLLLLLLF